MFNNVFKHYLEVLKYVFLLNSNLFCLDIRQELYKNIQKGDLMCHNSCNISLEINRRYFKMEMLMLFFVIYLK